MALGRPTNNDTRYKIIVHTLGKHRYASTKVATIGKMKFITPFMGTQVDICRAFGFTIPDG